MRKWLVMTVAMIGCVFTAMVFAAKERVMLTPGMSAPDFKMVSNSGDTVALSSYRNKAFVVLVFYPGDQTPGCTKQLCEFRDDYSQLQQSGAVVFGVNPANQNSHQKFVAKFNLPFPLLVDENSTVAMAYGCKGVIMTERTVFVIDPDGTIVFSQRGKPSPAVIIEAIKAAGKK